MLKRLTTTIVNVYRLDGLHDNSKAFNCKPFLEKRPDMSLPKPPLKEVERNLYNDKALRELYESLLVLLPN